MTHANPGWTSDRVDAVTALWIEGQSASQIAKQIGGVSRNAVIGKVHRLGLPRRGPASRKTSAQATHQQRARRAALAAAKPPVMRQAPQPRPRLTCEPLPPTATIDAAAGCRWIDGDPRAAEWGRAPICGRPAWQGSAWCAHHYARVFQPSLKKGKQQ